MAISHGHTGGVFDLGKLKEKAHPQPGGVEAFFAVDESNFETQLVRRSTQVPVIALIGTSRSTQSEQLRQDFEKLAAAGGLKFVVGYVDADSYPQIAQVFGVQNLPTVVALANGQPVTSFEGAQPAEALQRWVAALVEQVGGKLSGLKEPAPEEEPMDPRVEQAEEFLNAGDFDAAISLYDSILAEDPGATEVKQARDTARLVKRISQVEDPITVAETDASPQAQMNAADAEVAAGAPEKAFVRLIEAMKVSAPDEKDLLRERLLELFSLFDASDERVLDARRLLASALY